MMRRRSTVLSLDLVLMGVFNGLCYGRTEILTQEVMDMAVLGAQISVLTYDTARASDFVARSPIPADDSSYRGGVYVNEPNVALAARVDSTCIMAFRGTSTDVYQATWLDDVDTNLQQDQVTLLESCSVTQGILNAYNDVFRSDLEEDVRSCMTSCPDCNLLITGHSQGGAIANAAGVLFESYGYSPYVITYGQPPVLGSECRVDHWKWFRFIHAIPGTFRLQYDLVPMIRSTGTFYGHEIVVSSDDPTSVDYVGIDEHVDKTPWNVVAHFSNGYVAALTAVRDNGFPMHTNGFRSGAQCTMDAECASGSCAWRWFDVVSECS